MTVHAARRRYRSVVSDSARWDGFAFRDGDIVITTPPKCGTTWMQRLVALLVFDGPTLPAPMSKVSPWLDMQLARREDVVALLDAQQHRRFIKTHTPLDGIPYDERVRYVCVARDPRDVAVSSSRHMANMNVDRFMATRAGAVGLEDLPELGVAAPGPKTAGEERPFLESWLEDDGAFSVMSLASTVHHLQTCWDRRDLPNVALFHYADLLADLPGQLQRLASFLGYDVDAARAEQLAREASFDAMRSRAADVAPNTDIELWHDTTAFFHRGTSGQWKEMFGADDVRRYDERVGELAPRDLVEWLHR